MREGMRISRHFGLNRVCAANYSGWPGYLVACCADATDMAGLCARAGFEAGAVFDEEATFGRMSAEISGAAGRLVAGDWFLLSYSGHGAQRGSNWSTQVTTESLCLYDRLFDDSWFRDALGAFRAGVNVVVALDSCFSGGMDRASGRRVRVAPFFVTRKLGPAAALGRSVPQANVTLVAGADADETAADGDLNGAFTGCLLAAAAGGGQTWGELFAATAARMSRVCAYQHPQWIRVSGAALDGERVFAL